MSGLRNLEATIDPAKSQGDKNNKEANDSDITSHRGIVSNGCSFEKRTRKRRISHTKHALSCKN